MKQEMAPKSERLTMPALGEWYADLLKIDAWVNNRTEGVQGQGLLCSKLQERETRIRERIDYLAEKRGIDPKRLWLEILADRAERMTAEELAAILDECQPDPDEKK